MSVYWIKMPPGMEVGLGPGHTVLDRDPAPPPKKKQKGYSPCPIFSPRLLYQTAGWIKMPLCTEVGLGSGHIVLDGDLAPPKKGHSPHFSTYVYCGQTAGWIKMPLIGTKVLQGRPPPRPHCVVTWGPSSPPPKRGLSTPSFRPMSIVAKRSPISATAEHLLELILSVD